MLPSQRNLKDQYVSSKAPAVDVEDADDAEEEVSESHAYRGVGPVLVNLPAAPRPGNAAIYNQWPSNSSTTTTTTAATTITTTTTTTATATTADTANIGTTTYPLTEEWNFHGDCPDCYTYGGAAYSPLLPPHPQQPYISQFPAQQTPALPLTPYSAPYSAPYPPTYSASVADYSNSSSSANQPLIPQRFMQTSKEVEYPLPQVGHVQRSQARGPEYTGPALIFAAAAVGDIAQVKSLCRAGASVNATDRAGSTPLHYAVRAGNRRMIADLLDIGANIHAEDGDKNTAIDVAVDNKRYDIVQQLLRAGAQMADLHIDSQSVMADLIKAGEVELAKKFIVAKARTDIRDMQGRNYLHLAVLAKNVDMIRLFAVPALASADDNDQNTPLHLAVTTQDPEIMRAVLDGSPPLDALNRIGLSPVALACHHKSNIPLIQLLHAGCNPNAPDPTGNTPLHIACMRRSPAHVTALTARQANLAATNLVGQTPFALVERATDAEGIFIANLLRLCGSPQ